VVLLTLALGACEGGRWEVGVQASSRASMASSTEPAPDDTSGVAHRESRTPRATPWVDATPAGEKGEPPQHPPELPIRLSVNPGCGFRGQSLQAVIRTESDVFVSVTVYYSDYRMYGTHGGGVSSDEGRFVYNWRIPASAPSGWATVDVIGGREGPQGTEVGRADGGFVVADVGGCA